jgi:hypothetical protein
MLWKPLLVLALLTMAACSAPVTPQVAAAAAPPSAGAPATPNTESGTVDDDDAAPAAAIGAQVDATVPKALQVQSNELVLVGAGDIATCSGQGDEQTGQQVQRVLAASRNAWAFTTGDNVYPDGTMEQFRQCYEPAWGAFKQRTIPTVGNHDWRTPNAAGFRGTFAGRFSQDGPLWFAQDIEGVGDDGAPAKWRVVVLDSDCDLIDCSEGGPQARWLRAELQRQRDLNQRCSVVLFHHPRFSSGPHGDATFMASIWRQLAEGGVDLVLNGHDHIYERFAAMTADGTVDVKGGIPSIIVGTGGKSHYPAPLARTNSIVRSDNRDGVLVLRLNANGWKGALWATDNMIFDEHTGSCR